MLRIIFRHFFLVIPLFLFFWPQIILAADPPNLLSPADNSTETKPKLSWEYKGECVEHGSCFKVEIDNDSDFSSPEKSVYDTNSSYSPQGLTSGTHYWRVRAKDKSDTWSNWSTVFKFTIGSQTSSPSPSSSSSSAVQNSITPSPSILSQKLISNFSIKQIPSEINSDADFEVEVSLTLPNNPNQEFYLKGAFRKSESSNYFGETFTSGSWTKNSSSYSRQLKISTDSKGLWEGKIKVKPDSEDSGFEGSGEYSFKVGRYSQAGAGPNWSNELNLKVNAVSTPSPLDSSKESESPSEESEKNEEIDLTASLVKTMPARNYEIKIASVAGEATKSDNIQLIPEAEQAKVLEEKKVNWLLIVLGIAVFLIGAGFSLYKYKTEK